VWTTIRQATFEKLKVKLAAVPIISPLKWDQTFHVTLDASGWCLGAILWQKGSECGEKPIYFASQQMSAAEKNYTTTEREALAVITLARRSNITCWGIRPFSTQIMILSSIWSTSPTSQVGLLGEYYCFRSSTMRLW
jgi:hypothetical protein